MHEKQSVITSPSSSLKLTAKQQRFIDEYLTDYNGAAAAVRAGYTLKSAKVTAAKLLTKANLLTVIHEREASTARQLHITRERILGELQIAVAKAYAQHNPKAMIMGLREIAKMCGFYNTPHTPVTSTINEQLLVHKFSAMTDHELAALVNI